MFKNIIAGSFTTLVLIMPVVASADTLSELEGQMRALTAQMSALQHRIDILRVKDGKDDKEGKLPSCSIMSNKEIYTLGETIVFSWESEKATYATFVPDTSGKDNLLVPSDKLSIRGTQPIPGNVLGNPFVTLAVFDARGRKGTCSKAVSVVRPLSRPSTTVSSSTVGSVPASVTGTLTPGVLTVSLDASSPSYQLEAGGTSGVTLGVFKVRATGEAITLTKLGLALTSGKTGDLEQVSLFTSTGALIGNATLVGTTLVATSTLVTPLNVAQDSDALIIVKGDVSRVGTSMAGTSGDLVKLDALNFESIGVRSGSTIRGNAQSTVAGVRVFGSVPTVTKQTLPSMGIVDGRLLRFAVSASAQSSVGINKLSLMVSPVAANVTQLKLFVYTDSAYSHPVTALNAGGQFGATLANASGGAATAVFAPPLPLEIPPGQMYYFELRGVVAGTGAGALVNSSLIGDSGFHELTTAAGLSTSNFLWSGNTFTTSVGTDPDWSNGFGVTGLSPSNINQSRVAMTNRMSEMASAFGAIEELLDSLTYAFFPN